MTDRKDRQHISKLAVIDGKFFNVSAPPSGKSITLTDSILPVGYVTNPNLQYDAVAYGDHGFVKISGTKDSKTKIPAGDWRLLEYKIDATDPDSASSNRRGRGSQTYVTAAGTKECPVVKVEEGKTVVFPFGPPYKPNVVVYNMGRPGSRNENVRLNLNLVGSVGESCTNLMVNGDRPPDPSFVIATAENEIVERGKFEYG